MTMEGDGDKQLPDEEEVTGNRLVHEGENVVKDSAFNNETVNSVVEAGGVGTLQAKGSQLQQQEQSQGAAICWKRFLHVTSIKVLLVENDNSTRHIVTALLRNCNYEVIEAANGLQAWKILENLTNQVDLVLSEVVMPCLSGIGLLCKIMSHKIRKNIPVIMMSSHDSVGIVFKCLSKGAADFLVKPIRKNELKNLWQHVWRRCLSSSGSGSGSGSESGTQTQKSVKPNIREQSVNNNGKNDGEDILGNGALRDGSGSQSFSTKQTVEVDRSEAMSPCDQAPNSIHAHLICSNTETSARRNTHMNPSRYCQEEPDNTGKEKPTITGSLRDPEIVPENTTEVPFEHLGARNKSALEIDSNTSSLMKDKKMENTIGNCPPSAHNVVTAEMSHPQIDRRDFNKVLDALEINSTSADDSKHCVVELSLKRLRGLRESGLTFQDDRNVLRRSELSAFSRYNSSSNHTRTPKGVTEGSYFIEDCLKIAKKEPLHDIEAHMNEKLFNPRSNGVSNSIAMGSTTNLLTSKPLPLRNTVNSLHPSSAFKPVSIDCRSSSEQTPKVETGDVQTEDVLAPQSSDNNIVIQHPHQHHNHHHIHNLDQYCSSNHEDVSLKKHAMNGLDCGPSNVLAGSCEGNLEYYSSSKTASGSNHRRNGQIGSGKAINAECANGNCEAGSSGTSRCGGDASSSGSGNTLDPFKLVRAAALTKFRQKRKERCFMKKVRYQNRKRLAENRPRVRGQFVRQTEQSRLSNSADG